MPDNPRTAIVTGSARGIGAAIAKELAGRGLNVVVNHRTSHEAAQALVKEIADLGGTAVAHAADVTDPDAAAALVERAVSEFGGLDVLVCNANVGLGMGSVTTVEWSDFAAKVNDELAAVFHPTRAALPHLTARGRGHIVYLSSDAHRGPASPMMLAHSTAKAAMNTYALYVAKDSAPHNITVNVLSAGLVRTESTSGIPQQMWDQMVGRIPVGRASEPEDLARAVGFLTDPATSCLTGQVISLNGGSNLGN
ncbi:SDR family oxidoreductase [Streptomyces sp. SL13]|uniref:SDR family oxidoreductase n=1 Tax=Streptantibioticus silvisoli TaxID=2705255 RepID=A0AA90K021_9ACTN|nr:SDR family oxidoreductase [Streptantibioticus silvisoli]MDI5965418.1 SDR family oxidoreductase [Streptantibioticus silvisoli]MDI5972656.1 SDR family oxidoreductase [Streptantibioticus silvisoli]